MQLNLILKTGIADLKFGMIQNAVEALLGQPDLVFNDDDENIIWLYNVHKLRLTFYADEDFKLGYVVCSHPDMTIFNEKIYQKPVDEVLALFKKQGITNWEEEKLDAVFIYFNEDHWVVLQIEFGELSRIELGVVQKNLDEFDWQY